MPPFFSIIIPVYNVAPYLRECLDSVLAQTFVDWEAICVDDGSTDGSGKILDEYASRDKRFKVVHKSNSGPSSSRNVGIDMATGHRVVFVDSDDLLAPMALEVICNVKDDVDVIFYGMDVFYHDGFRNIISLPQVPPTILTEETAKGITNLFSNLAGIDAFGWTCDKSIKRSLLVEGNVRFEESINYFEDELFALDLMRFAKSYAVIPNACYSYRIQSSSITRSSDKKYYPIATKFAQRIAVIDSPAFQSIALSRARQFYRNAVCQKNGYRAACALMSLEKQYSDGTSIKGGYQRLIARLMKIPTFIAGMVLWLTLNVRKGL